MAKFILTGGAGFIGSHFLDHLMENGHEILVIDDLSSGDVKNIERWIGHERLTFLQEKIRDVASLPRAFSNAKAVFHFAALPEVRVGPKKPQEQWERNVVATYHLLELIRTVDIPYLLFASSSVVYGVPQELPTPEEHPLQPISIYGGTKVACEGLISSYAHTFNIRSLSFRFANIVGSRIKGNVIYDFIQKLKESPEKLKILGDGTQNKSYLHVSDLVSGVLKAFETFQRENKKYDVYNIGNNDRTDVMTIAKIVSDVMDLEPEYHTTGGVEGGRGWKGDVKEMLLEISKLKKTGWKPRYSSDEAVRITVKQLSEALTSSSE